MCSMHEKCLLCLNDVLYEIDGKPILSNISVQIDSEGITGIIGASGSGKSTFLRLLNRLVSPTSGSLFFNGKNFGDFLPRELRKQIGMVQQQAYLFGGTVRDNLEYGPRIWNISYSDEDLIGLLAKVALGKNFLERDVSSLSGGEQQRVNVARMLANRPTILLLDEPTSALDIVSAELLEKTILQLSKEGIKMIIVTHSLEQTKRLTDQLLFLSEGKLIEKTTTKNFFEKYTEQQIRSFFNNKEEEQ